MFCAASTVMIASIAESTMAASCASRASVRCSATSTWRAATMMPAPITSMSARITPPSSQGASRPRTKATAFRPSSATSAAAPAPTTAGMAKQASFDQVKVRPFSASIVPPMHYPASELVIDPVLIRKYDVSGPRYTSYPTADRFVEAFGEPQLRAVARAGATIGGFASRCRCTCTCRSASTLCYYCACNKIITRDRARRPSISSTWSKELALSRAARAATRARSHSCTGAAARRPSSRATSCAR